MKRPAREECINVATHGLGILLSLIGNVWMWVQLSAVQDLKIVFGCCIFGFALVAVYSCSTLSHWYTDEKRQGYYRRLDQAFIYILIVGSYTPFSGRFLDGYWWGTVLIAMWLVAVIGFLSKIFFAHRVQRVSIWIYLLLGWIPAVAGIPLTPRIPFECKCWIVAGGIAYTVGTMFLFQDKKLWFFHGIWHLFVILGSLLHFLAVAKFVIQS